MGILFNKSKEYISRDAWDALAPLSVTPFNLPIVNVFLTSVGSQNSVRILYKGECFKFLRELQKHQVFDLGLSDITYNFFIGADGKIYEGRGWQYKPILTRNENPYNAETLAIAYIRESPQASNPSELMITKVKEVIEKGVNEGLIHEQYSLTGIKYGFDK